MRLFILSCFPAVALAAIASSVIPVRAFAADGSAGLAKEQPASGRFVKTDQGFMVPYEAKIPGTDVTFQMQPIAGGKFKLGSPESEADRKEDEGPQVEIEVEPFWIG